MDTSTETVDNKAIRPWRILAVVTFYIVLLAGALWGVSLLVDSSDDLLTKVANVLQPGGAYWPSYALAGALLALTATAVIVVVRDQWEDVDAPGFSFWSTVAVLGPPCYLLVVAAMGQMDLEQLPQIARWFYLVMTIVALPTALLLVLAVIVTLACIGDHAARWSGMCPPLSKS